MGRKVGSTQNSIICQKNGGYLNSRDLLVLGITTCLYLRLKIAISCPPCPVVLPYVVTLRKSQNNYSPAIVYQLPTGKEDITAIAMQQQIRFSGHSNGQSIFYYRCHLLL